MQLKPSMKRVITTYLPVDGIVYRDKNQFFNTQNNDRIMYFKPSDIYRLIPFMLKLMCLYC